MELVRASPKPMARLVGWLAVVVNLCAIAVGSVVRATGSGAGCGRSWPTCQGVVIPELAGATALEFTHRVVSGVALLAVVGLLVAVWRSTPVAHPARLGAVLSLIAVVVESLIGAMIVLAEWVAGDASPARVVAVPLHLVNTLFLLSALTLTVYWLGGGSRLRLRRQAAGLLAVGAGLVVVAATGAVTALADTLFPRPSLLGGGGTDDVRHFLTGLRVVHPFVAVAVAVAGIWVARPYRDSPAAQVAILTLGVGLVLGAANVVFGTPLWLSVPHLLVADLTWIAWTWLTAQRLAGNDLAGAGVEPF
ncbi:MAG: cytochrome oxidase assembly protein [Acidimicrobiia bacterium]|nr:MAG: cytochrome oxidase assembly protein [Acidimicrobiia bacterium]